MISRVMNVLLITVDALRADHVGFIRQNGENCINESSKSLTPNIDKLAADGTRCLNLFATAGFTRMSFPGIMSGVYPPNSSLYNGKKLQGERTIGDVFDSMGYQTVGFHSNPFLSDGTGYESGFGEYRDFQSTAGNLERFIKSKLELYTAQSPAYRPLKKLYLRYRSLFSDSIGLPYVPAKRLVREIENRAESITEPFFFWCHFMDPHAPYQPHIGTGSEYIQGSQAIDIYNKIDMTSEAADFSEYEMQMLRDLYRGEVEYVDESIGDMVEFFENTFRNRELLIVFVSDHGEELGEHGNIGHGPRFYDSNIHVPCFITQRGDGPQCDMDKTLSTVDILPSIADLIDYDKDIDTDGESFYASSNYNNRSVFAYGDNSVLITDGEYKIVKDLRDDEYSIWPRKKLDKLIRIKESDVARSERLSGHVQQLIAQLNKHLEAVTVSEFDVSNSDLPKHIQAQLEALGYR